MSKPMGFDVAVIGGGVIGTSVAYHAAKRGLSVGLFEKGPLASGASGASLGLRSIWVWSHLLPLESGLKNDQRFIDFSQETGEDIELDTNGRIIVANSEDDLGYMHEFVERLQKRGIEIRLLDQAEIRDVEPNLSPRVIGAAWSPIGGNAMPIKLTYALARSAKRLGASIFTHTPVSGIDVAGGRAVGIHAGGRQYRAQWVVNAAGAWSAEIGNFAGVDVPVVPRKGQVMLLNAPPGFVRHGIASLHKPGPQQTGGTNIRPTPHGQIICGGTSEYSGFDTTAREENARDIARRCVDLVPALAKLSVLRSWAGVRPRTADGEFIISGAEQLDNFLVATGHDFVGVTHSLVTGELITELMTDGKTSVPTDGFRLSRFKAPKSEQAHGSA
jgi:glycine/D-amino acid oxidase-like deaminating enzyme